MNNNGISINHSRSNNIFDVYFSYDDVFHKEVSFLKSSGKRHHISQPEYKYPLSFMINKSDLNELHIEIEYSSETYSENLIDQIFSGYMGLIDQFLLKPNELINSISLSSNEVLKKYKRITSITSLSHSNIIESIFKVNESVFNRIAIKDINGYEYTYIQLLSYAYRISEMLSSSVQEVVAIKLNKSFDQIACLLASFMSNNIYLPLAVDIPKIRMSYILDDSDVRFLVEYDEKGTLILRDLKNEKSALISNKNLSGIKYLESIKFNKDIISKPAYIIYTSGTTGKPKAVIQTHRTLVNLIDFQKKQLHDLEFPIVTQIASLSFDVSLQEIFYALASGGKLILCDKDIKLNPNKIWSLFDTEKVAVTFIPPAILQLLAEESINNKAINYGLYNLKYIICAGEQLKISDAIRAMLKIAFRHACPKLYNHYGPTETHVVTSFGIETTETLLEDFPSIGKPIQNVQCYILNKYKDLMPYGMRGNLYISGDTLALGYLNREKETKEKFINTHYGRLYDTGDITYYFSDNLYFEGRSDHQISINGYRVEPKEIESVIMASKLAIEQCLVIKVNINDQNQLCCYYKSKGKIDSNLIITHCQSLLLDYMIPVFYVQVSKFPLTANGKIDIKSLPKPKLNTNKKSRALRSSKVDSIQKQIIAVLQEYCDYPVSITDNILQIGISSLNLVRVLSKLSKLSKVEIFFRDLVHNSTIFLLDRWIKKQIDKNLISSGSGINEQIRRSKISYQQKRIIKDIKNGQNPVANNLALIIRFNDKIDLSKLSHSINLIVNRHDIFKLSMKQTYNNENLVKGYTLFSEELLVQEVTGDILAYIDQLIHYDFYPYKNGFGQFHLLRSLQNNHIYFVMVIHHLIFDGISLGHELMSKVVYDT